MLAITGVKDRQVPPEDLAVVAGTAAGPVETQLVPDLTHTLRRQPGPASLGAYKKELRSPVDAEVVGTVVGWCRRTTRRPDPIRQGRSRRTPDVRREGRGRASGGRARPSGRHRRSEE